MTELKNPIQPLVNDSRGVLRFKRNVIVDALLEHGQKTGFGLNEIAHKFHGPEYADDHSQLAQLIGYSLSGYADLHYVSDETFGAASLMATDGLSEKDARIAHLESKLLALRSSLCEPMARLFGVHPDDLKAGL